MTDVILVAGRDPLDEVSGGHSAYVRSYARAALAAGFTPHLFCAGRTSRTWQTDLGTIHRVASPYRPFRQMLAALHARPLADAIADFGATRGSGSLLIHSFGVWGIVAARAAPRLRARGVEPLLIQSSYTTYRDEALAHVRGADAGAYPRLARMRFSALSWWVAAAVERWERQAYRAARLVLVNYESVARLVRRRHGMDCRVMPYAAESAFFDRGVASRAADSVPSIVSIARHEPRKGNDVLLRALAQLRSEGVAFRARLAGGGPLLAHNRTLAHELGLDDCVALEGVVPDVRPLLDEAGIFVLPSREEQSGSLAILEALQSGLAIVASAVDGIAEDLHGGDALLVSPGDAAALAAAIRSLLLDAALRRRLQQRARELFDRRFAAGPFAAALGAIYRELLAE